MRRLFVIVCCALAVAGLAPTAQAQAVNTAPVLDPIGNKSGSVGSCQPQPVTFTATATDSDLPPQTLTFSLGPGAPAGATIDPSTGAFSWLPTTPGLFPVTVVVTDNGSPALSDSETIQISVAVVNSTPVLSAIGNKTVDEGSLLTFVATAFDACPDPLVFTLGSGAPAGASITLGGTPNTASGTFTWTPTEAQGPGTHSVTVIVTSAGASNTSDSETIMITVREVNTAPVLAPIGNKSSSVGCPVNFTASATDADIPGNTLTFSIGSWSGPPPAPTIGAVTGNFSWFPTAMGTFQATIVVTDNGTPPLNDSEVILITVGGGSNTAPVLGAIGNKTVNELALLTFTATATDPDVGQTLTFSLGPGAPLGATIEASTGTFNWTPAAGQDGDHAITIRVMDGGGCGTPLTDQETITVTVLGTNDAPLADANGPYMGIQNEPVEFDGTGSADPEGTPLTYLWDFGDGSSGSGVTPSHTYTESGLFIVTLTVSDGSLSDTDQTTATILDDFTATAFVVGGNKTIRLNSGKPQTCVQIEPSGGAFETSDVDLSSVRMVLGSNGIPAISDKTAVGDDKNQNGVSEITACFSKENLRVLFGGQPTGDYEVTLEGDLTGGGRFHADLTIHVVTGGSFLSASISPNPLNPKATVTFATSKPAMVKVRLFDVQGRLIRTLMDEPSAAAGYHDVTIDGHDANGSRLASGIYYVKIHTSSDGSITKAVRFSSSLRSAVDGEVTKAITMLK